ncbi:MULTISPECIES: UDP-N-acetylmuramate dehydrogenase [unclassified Acidocella]|uniref:UDP-N-acetylmuramate dehydrogenase n=1 Tax=unclassified Acidocella TaxID=2648610 RepID=UPI00028DCB24|nr:MULTISPECIES: UDP-N-acetylmuramate dehydrogenase [unclassified Acidocella]EKN00083.1 UDP-N-acetylenolpyruvoylglucosamine reductase [Acidocella sp. MX-AZ02]WBO59665.1 UDP-N-acetylmuramate dehydrogenase [Acidocella sp. MX-AZ03]
MMASTIPATRGRLKENETLAPMTWFRVGGPAEFLLRPADIQDLCDFMAQLPLEMPITVIGAASNLIVRDGGINGVVIKLARGFGEVEIEADGIIAGAAALDITVSEHAASAGLSGLEFLSGIPGTIGGAVAMNAGAYGGDMAGVLDWVEIVTRAGELKRLAVQELGLTYRHSNLPADAVVVRARLRAQPGEPALIAARMAEIKTKREATQPVRARTGGSTFANPDGQKAWELVDGAGCRGLTVGQAQVSDLHCNFLLNLGGATAAELEGLGEEVRKRVLEKSGVSLRWEIKRIGVPA